LCFLSCFKAQKLIYIALTNFIASQRPRYAEVCASQIWGGTPPGMALLYAVNRASEVFSGALS
jgi:hypothetical protein